MLRRNVSSKLLLADGVEGVRGRAAPPSVLTSRSMRPNASMARSVSIATAASVSMDPATPTACEPFGAQGSLGRGHPILVAAVDDHRRALSRQAEGAGPADARIGCRPGDDGDPAGEPLSRSVTEAASRCAHP